jgi:hypothetical protein
MAWFDTTRGYRSLAVSRCEAVHTEPETSIGLVSAVCGALERSSVDQGRTSPVKVVVVHRSRSSCRERWRLRPQAFDPAEDLGEQGARHRCLGQLEHHVAAGRWRTIRAPILTSFSRNVVSHQCSTLSGRANLRR